MIFLYVLSGLYTYMLNDHENNPIASATGELITQLICQLKSEHILIKQLKIDHPFGR